MLPYHAERPLAGVEVPSLDKQSIKDLPPALRQLADHNPRGDNEGEALPPRRKRKAILLGPDFVKEPSFRSTSPKKGVSQRTKEEGAMPGFGGGAFGDHQLSHYPDAGEDDGTVVRQTVSKTTAGSYNLTFTTTSTAYHPHPQHFPTPQQDDDEIKQVRLARPRARRQPAPRRPPRCRAPLPRRPLRTGGAQGCPRRAGAGRLPRRPAGGRAL